MINVGTSIKCQSAGLAQTVGIRQGAGSPTIFLNSLQNILNNLPSLSLSRLQNPASILPWSTLAYSTPATMKRTFLLF